MIMTRGQVNKQWPKLCNMRTSDLINLAPKQTRKKCHQSRDFHDVVATAAAAARKMMTGNST